MNIIGNGSLAKQIKDVIDSFNTYSISCKGKIETVLGAEYLEDNDKRVNDSYLIGFASLDNLFVREEVFEHLCKEGKQIGVIISPKATVSADAYHIGEGCVVLHNAFIGSKVFLEQNVLIGTGAIVEHDSCIGPHSVVLTGAIINGKCNIGQRCMIGSGAVIINNISICDDVKIGAGAVVTKHIDEPGTYVGIPARRLTHD